MAQNEAVREGGGRVDVRARVIAGRWVGRDTGGRGALEVVAEDAKRGFRFRKPREERD